MTSIQVKPAIVKARDFINDPAVLKPNEIGVLTNSRDLWISGARRLRGSPGDGGHTLGVGNHGRR